MALLSKEAEAKLRKIYYDPNHPAGLGSVAALAAAAKIAPKKVKLWLRKQKTYTLHRQARKRYPTRKYYVNNIDDQWQMDLADMIQLKRFNQGFRYILTCIDILSRYGWARPLKSKSGVEVAAAIEDILISSGRSPKRIQTDQGKEFYNAPVKRLLENHNIELFSVKSPFKSAMVERWNRTIKTKLWKYFTSENHYKWLDVLPKIIHAYNNSYHRVIKMKPKDINEENSMLVWERLYGRSKRNQRTIHNLNEGDRVRISKFKGQFEKGYLPNWSREEFIVDKVNEKFLPSMLSLKDYHGEIIEGNFYGDEVQKIDRDQDDDVYDVEKILQRKRRNGELWYFVKWLGYDNSFNSWIRAADVADVFTNNNPESSDS